jgi:hypothetical protein
MVGRIAEGHIHREPAEVDVAVVDVHGEGDGLAAGAPRHELENAVTD